MKSLLLYVLNLGEESWEQNRCRCWEIFSIASSRLRRGGALLHVADPFWSLVTWCQVTPVQSWPEPFVKPPTDLSLSVMSLQVFDPGPKLFRLNWRVEWRRLSPFLQTTIFAPGALDLTLLFWVLQWTQARGQGWDSNLIAAAWMVIHSLADRQGGSPKGGIKSAFLFKEEEYGDCVSGLPSCYDSCLFSFPPGNEWNQCS